MKLRSFLYLNTKLVNDYISAIEGYVHDSETRTENKTSQKSVGAKGGVAVISGNGQIETKATEEIKKDVLISDAAKFDKVFSYLNQDDGIAYYEFISDEKFLTTHRDDFLEVLVVPRFSKTKEMADTAKKIGELAEIFQTLSEQPLIDKKGQAAITGFSKLGEIKAGKEISCVFNFEDKKFPIVAYLDEQYFNVQQDQFVGQVYMLCKIQRKIEKGQVSNWMNCLKI